MQQSHSRLALHMQTLRRFITRCVRVCSGVQAALGWPRSAQSKSLAVGAPAALPPANLDPQGSLTDCATPYRPSESRRHPTRHRRLDWVIPGQLAVGALPQAPLAQTLSEHQIKVVLSVCAEHEGRLPKAIRQGFRCLRVPLTDSRSPTPLDLDGLSEAVDLIQWNISKRMPVYIHCLAGMERSPTVCLAYLCRYQQFDLIDGLSWLRHIHPKTRITGAQLNAVRYYLQNRNPSPPKTDGLNRLGP